MKKVKVIFLLLLMLFNTQLFSQKLYTEKMEWRNKDTIESLTFENIDKLIEWGKNTGTFGYIESELFSIKNLST